MAKRASSSLDRTENYAGSIPQGSPTKQDPPPYFFMRPSGRSDARCRLTQERWASFSKDVRPPRERDSLEISRSAAQIYSW